MKIKLLLLLTYLLVFSGLLSQTLDTLPKPDSIFTTIDLDQFIVTGQYAPTDSRTSVYDVKVIDRKTMELTGSTNLQQILTTELNIDVSQDQFLGGSISLQGTNEENIKILKD